MTPTLAEITQIVAEASYLSERLTKSLFAVDTTQIDDKQVSERLERWCQAIAQGNWEKFQQRLQWDGWDIESVRPFLGKVQLVNHSVLPSWGETLKEIIQTTAKFPFQNATQYRTQIQSIKKFPIPINPENPLPFEDVLLPVLLVASQKLLIHLRCFPLELLSEETYLELECSLLHRLINCCEKTLELEFSRYRPSGYSLLSSLVGEISGTHGKVHYHAFVQKLLSDGLLRFFQKYPVLGRFIATVVDFWVEATADFLQRLKTDLSTIEQVFPHPEIPQTSIGKVTEIKPSLSDFHNRGRSVIALTFESGLKLIYKPKNLGLEVAYGQILEWCNQHGIPLAFKVVRVLNRETYGWVEFIEQQPCVDEAAAQRFYQRAGMLLCLLYVLGATDCHLENLIASGEHLVLIDMETLMQPQVNPMYDSGEVSEAATLANQLLWDSVLRTGLLPRWEFSHDRRTAYDISGLGSVDPLRIAKRVRQWKCVNTDDMHLGYEMVARPLQGNVAFLNGVALSPNDYLEDLISGFEQMYRFLIARQDVLLSSDSPLKALQAQWVRFVFRITHVYAVILQKTLSPEFLRSGVDCSLELDAIAQAFLVTQVKPKAWPIFSAELAALQQLDVPYFGVFSDSCTIDVGLEQPIEQYFQQSCYSQVISRFQQLDEMDLSRQIAIIQGSFYARVARTPSTEKKAELDSESDLQSISPLSVEQLLEEAVAIASEIQEQSLQGVSGSLNWMGIGYVPNAERFQLQLLDDSLYHGNCGIALFLSALYQITGNTQFKDLAFSALHSIRHCLQTSSPDFMQTFAKQIGIGGATGIGSIIYSLVRTSQFLETAALLEDAQRVAHLMTPALIACDRQLDIVGGASGAILGLLALYHQTKEPAVLQQALACGQHLLQHRTRVDNSPRAWKTVAKIPLTGFSHGAASIAYALLRLYALTNDKAYLEAACEGIAYERSVFSPSETNWPDLRFAEQQQKFMVSWCHGASGIGLARLGSLSILETDEIYQEIEMALQATQKYSWQDVDHLCCGNFGRIEVLLVASQKLSRPCLQSQAHKQASWVVNRAKQAGGYKLFANLPNHVFNPSFFQGIAGIGYELLRLAYPEILPSVLLWD
ncbi:type 2 lantipeptide synthetase LanM [Scytonema sp. UIC 10036]|uniref:type 2 lanthipeptide synthetase LanM family protein n=1 Tax=Scytonema sp. UIC 10036 TaxID=2304196 RepID=UPI0012DA984E|nr:type 2 lanthipeptide synthetase LanM family protein [Scytonema sp. UIC 10036]MUG95826.1 type 2 lantipeptide synthetase LanM [Scytonema sp. UIC 10036]